VGHIHNSIVGMWKNIPERLQKYDTMLTKLQPIKNFFSLAWLEFQPIDNFVMTNMS